MDNLKQASLTKQGKRILNQEKPVRTEYSSYKATYKNHRLGK